jgi:hypothetical protein
MPSMTIFPAQTQVFTTDQNPKNYTRDFPVQSNRAPNLLAGISSCVIPAKAGI